MIIGRSGSAMLRSAINGRLRPYGVEPAQVALDHVGLNHLTWTRRVLVDEQDRLPELLATSAEALAGRSGLPADVLRRLGCGLVLPSLFL